MTATKDIGTIAAQQGLPIELLAPAAHRVEGANAASMLSGMVSTRQPDEAICPQMLRRNLLIPSHQGQTTRHAWRVV